MIKGVIFDMDGLMFDTERIWATLWRPALATLGLSYKEGLDDAVRGTAGDSMRAVLRRFFGGAGHVACGWWDGGVDDPGVAVDRLLDELICGLPTRLRRVLDLSAAPLSSAPRLAARLPVGVVEVVDVLSVATGVVVHCSTGRRYT